MHILYFIIFYLPAIFAQVCENLPNQIDQGFRELFFFGKTLPTTTHQYSQYCRKSRQTLENVKSYGSSCLTGLPAQLVNIFHHGGLKAAKKNCAIDTIEDITKSMQCVSSDNLKSLQKCYVKAEKMLDFISKRVRENNIISALCCALRINFECIDKIGVEDCGENLKFKDFIYDSYTLIFDDLMDFMCGNFRTLAQCKDKKSFITNKLMKINSSQISKIKAQGMITPMLKIVNKLSQL